MTHSEQSLREMQAAVSAMAFGDEANAVRHLLSQLAPLDTYTQAVHARARALAESLRQKSAVSGVEAFLHEYGLDTREGVAVMSLAEALLRIPDAHTADRLIRDTFEQGQWDKHLGGSDSFLVNASSWGLLLTGKLVQMGHEPSPRPAHMLGRLVSKFGEPLIREALKAAMRFIGAQFVMGEDMAEALRRSRPYMRKGYRFSYDMLGEAARSEAQAEAYLQAYHEAIALAGRQAEKASLWEAPGISVKLSALHPRYQLTQEARLMDELLPRLKEIALHAMHMGITLAIDAEESSRLDIEMKLFARLFADEAFSGWEGLGFVVQAYQKRAFALLDFLAALSRMHARRMPLRLVKGAYWDSEIKWAQMLGLPGYPVFTRKEHTDVSYLACADKMLRTLDCFYPQFATHNARTVASIEALARAHGAKDTYELQRLHGMGEALHDMLLETTPSRIYAPVGKHKDLLAYLIRRLLENGANTSFVHMLMDHARPVEELIADPVAAARLRQGTPDSRIPLPVALHGKRWRNSQGHDFGNLAQMQALTEAVEPFKGASWPAPPSATVETLTGALQTARAAFPGWGATPVEERAGALDALADSLEQNRAELIALLGREAGRTLADADAEVREAADFCRYYAYQARRLMSAPEMLPGPTGESNRLSLHPRGVFACISPWNFPLSIFTGQVAAALVTGNCVIAKPAEQTPHVAARAVSLMHEAGVPRGAVQLQTGSGETIGAELVASAAVDGVVFTGSVETARHIAASLASREGALVPFIAETGGQNCMVVDSSALLEQAVDDIIVSAFGSAGQRCSSLCVLYVQEEVADALLTLLSGAMQELSLGDPLLLATDIGPIIDEAAASALHAHLRHLRQTARFIAATAEPQGRFIPPHAFEIRHIGELKGEVFGPVLHVIRFPGGKLQQVADAVNSTGYGLTFGLQSRVQEHTDFFADRIKAGNLYVNRSMIGAAVGVQPFGGEGLSGTGPKAGGPHYLLRFVTERTVTVNIAAVGGNISLLSGASDME
ncbi:MAG: L-glutamate gamma-semialdehyde dehydrogenase [Alphaproteobacteria bacterium]|nr:L-glutamate gamma-semialdehyde dehydrogenase [Alphaproteobacteria bacterium]